VYVLGLPDVKWNWRSSRKMEVECVLLLVL